MNQHANTKDIPIMNEESGTDMETYWDGVLTGDLSTVPRDVRMTAGIPDILGEDDEERLAGRIVRSWAVDHMSHTREEIETRWADIRRDMTGGLGAGNSDRELFLALSVRNGTKRNDRKKLEDLYGTAYEHALQSGGNVSEGEFQSREETLPDSLKQIGAEVWKRGACEGEDDRRRLAGDAERVWNGMKSFMRYEGVEIDDESGDESFLSKLACNPLIRALWHTPDMGKAVETLRLMSEEDRKKVYGMLMPRMKERLSLEDGITRSVNRGLMNTAYNVYLAKLNSEAAAMLDNREVMERLRPGGGGYVEKKGNELSEKARIFHELRSMTQDRMFPVHSPQADWIDDLLVDSAHAAAPAALAFTGGSGIGLLAISETGRQMGDARVMNPEGDYQAQMKGATASGVAGALLSLGMTKLGQKVASAAIRSFRAYRGASSAGGAFRSLGQGTVQVGSDTGAMVVENKLQELAQYGGQEAAAIVSGKESGVPWEDWERRNLSFEEQLKEAGTMFPYILLGAGKVGLHHFRESSMILNNRKALGMLDIPEEIVEKIRREQDTEVQTFMLKDAITSRPLWGSLFFGKKAFEWANLLESSKHPLFSSLDEVRDFMDMIPQNLEKPWKPTGKLADLWYGSHGHPDEVMAAQVARGRWIMRAGLPEIPVWETAQSTLISEYRQTEFQKTDPSEIGKNSALDRERALSEWHRKELLNERENLSIVNSDPDQSILPAGLRGGGNFHPDVQQSRLDFMADRTRSLVQNAYRLLLLKYPDPDLDVEAVLRKPEAWDERTEEMNRRLKTIVMDGALQLADNRPAVQVDSNLSWKFWKTWLEEVPPTKLKTMAQWMEQLKAECPESYRNRLGLCLDFDVSEQISPERLTEYFMAAEDWAALVPSRVREKLPEPWKALNRICWSLKADTRIMKEIVPELYDFDVALSRGELPRDAFVDLVLRELQMTREKLQGDFLASSIKRAVDADHIVKTYGFMKSVLNHLESLAPRSMISTTGADRKKYFRVRYPDGNLSAWHGRREDAVKDLASHLAVMYSPSCGGKWEMARQWASFALNEGRLFRIDDFNVSRLKTLDVSGSLYEQLTAHTVAELVEAGYGRRSFRAPGEKILIAPEDMGTRSGLLDNSLEKMRKEVYRKYVGPMRDMGCAAANGMGFGADGILWNNLVLYDHFSPLAMIEDKAEVVWSRLLSSGQLPVDEGCRLLSRFGRTDIPESEFARNAHLLVEELSQLSKEYYMAHLDHASVPESVPMWVKYTAMRPFPNEAEMNRLLSAVEECAALPESRLTSVQKEQLGKWAMAVDAHEIRRLIDSSGKRVWEQDGMPDFFVHMIADSAGMNNMVRAERVWSLEGGENKSLLKELAADYRERNGAEFHYYPAMERYVHAIADNRLAEVLPSHILSDLNMKLKELPLLPDEAVVLERDHGGNLLSNLSSQLEHYPELSLWRTLQDGTYGVLTGLGEAERSFPPLRAAGWRQRIPGKRVRSGYGPLVGMDYGMEYRKEMAGFPHEVRIAFETLEIIRRDFASRPMPTSAGIVWNGSLLVPSGNFAPAGFLDGWKGGPVLGNALFRLGELPVGETVGGVRVPEMAGISIPELEGAFASMNLYRSPQNAGHTVRVMPGIPHSPLPEARSPFVVHQYHGVFLDEHGNPVFPEDMRRSYIPLERFRSGEVRCDMDSRELSVWRRMAFHRYLEELGDVSLHQKRWWTPGTGDSSYQEAVIRLYEELGIGYAVDTGRMAGDDPRAIQMLRMICPLMSKPGFLYSFDQYDGTNHQSAIGEGSVLYDLFSINPLNDHE